MWASVLALPTAGHAFCFAEAGAAYGHDPRLLAAIAEQESRYNPEAIGPVTRSGHRAYCMMQVLDDQAPALAKRGLSMDDLRKDPCLCVMEGARILREKVDVVGPTWKAVGAYYAGERGGVRDQEWYASQVKVRYAALLEEPLPGPGYKPPRRDVAGAAERPAPPMVINVPAGESAVQPEHSGRGVIILRPAATEAAPPAPPRPTNDFVFTF